MSLESRILTEIARIVVSDDGPGIPQESLDHIFDRFERGLNRSGVGGLGLGLFIAREIVIAHGGRISAESGESCCARFIVELPIGA